MADARAILHMERSDTNLEVMKTIMAKCVRGEVELDPKALRQLRGSLLGDDTVATKSADEVSTKVKKTCAHKVLKRAPDAIDEVLSRPPPFLPGLF